jgi:hypothetical protein
MEQLQRLIQQLQNPRRAQQQENMNRLGQEALYNLQKGMPESEGSNENSRALLGELEEALETTDRPIDPVQLQQLLDKLRRFSQELASTQSEPEPQPELSNIDPARWPPAYRARIEKYFQKLSER